ncbi:MAG: peptidyl-prolyl cis-trans isomerase [Phenylobacterium sp.]|uniref:peptidylprolyl isomerase n=1 Tax=Phenylobacterium sp. TaxID=1871053 RepID=UPI0025ED848C|nr:peptidylprolyl isomerase [Phenylobacterium sp.]MBI1196801.1 peptidyl-prolyl cis-trans isomerase [Phenylobacterium sp.]
MDARTRWLQADGRRTPGRWKARAVRILREPLLHFLIAGAVILCAVQWWRASHDERRIVVGDAQVAELVGKHRLQYGRDPTPAQIENLIRGYVDEEILYREGRALGLDRDDEIVRRRVAQKVEFLRQDLAIPAEPDEAALRRYFTAHAAQYAQPPRASFRQLYFSPDKGGWAPARGRAEAALARLRAGAPWDKVDADAFPDQSQYAAISRVEAARVFGVSGMAEAVEKAPVGRWAGPYASGYGWHLVLVQARYPGAPGDFDALRETVRGDYLRDAQVRANAQAMERMRARYAVVRQDRARP